MTRVTPLPRRGFTVIESLAALAGLMAAMVLVAQVGTAALSERVRADARLEAGEAAANVLEAARATPWDGLTPAWAAGQKLPDHLAGRLADGTLTAAVEPEPGRPRVKRVTVAVGYRNPGGEPARPVTLVALFAARTGEGRK